MQEKELIKPEKCLCGYKVVTPFKTSRVSRGVPCMEASLEKS